MKEIKTLLVDDETGALTGLRGMITEFCPQIKVAGEATTVKVRDILYCKSDGAALEIFAQRSGKTERLLLYRTLKELEAQLPEALFCRVHHSFMVNLAHIERYEITKSARTIYLHSGIEIPISIQKTEQFGRKMAEFLQ